ncbi:hypothetical protein GUJ93_ZPchr0012g19652 [Zizania palustris]|uniref:Uncharacterized protein n=1 Tax=Zizania palustris TaxID=103762 RepID=A0A8J6BWR6_ZIZPA|nr:hypothetical protein GUJ93_ZPchr0012g19652 [Zizania palustris]
MNQHAFNRHSKHYYLSLYPAFMDIIPEPSCSTPLDVASPYVAFDADAVIEDPADIAPTTVDGNVTAVVVVEANISEDVATDSGESTNVADIITSSDTTVGAPSATTNASH